MNVFLAIAVPALILLAYFGEQYAAKHPQKNIPGLEIPWWLVGLYVAAFGVCILCLYSCKGSGRSILWLFPLLAAPAFFHFTRRKP